jgi:nucleotide-binding universal stress UspA family protein
MAQIKKIVCPVDFFLGSERAADYAIELAKRYEAKVIFLHVISLLTPSKYVVRLNTGDVIGAMKDGARDELKKLAARAEREGIDTEILVKTGEIDLSIRSVVDARQADLIIMGTRGRRALEKFFIGSVTDRILRRVTVPLLTLGSVKRIVSPLKVRHVLVATDFSPGTADAVSYALSVARACESTRVTLLHVLNDVDAEISGRYRDRLIRSIHAELRALVPDDVESWCEVRTLVEKGTPSRRILPLLKKEKVDLLVMDVSGKTLLDRVIIGSTAESVVRGAEIPVLIVPPSPPSRRRQRVPRQK